MVPWTATPASPRWTHDWDGAARSRAHGVRVLQRAGARCDEGKRERRATHFSPRASVTGEEAHTNFDGEAKGKWRGGTQVGGGCGVKIEL
jgi:hypothetical protein